MLKSLIYSLIMIILFYFSSIIKIHIFSLIITGVIIIFILTLSSKSQSRTILFLLAGIDIGLGSFYFYYFDLSSSIIASFIASYISGFLGSILFGRLFWKNEDKESNDLIGKLPWSFHIFITPALFIIPGICGTLIGFYFGKFFNTLWRFYYGCM